jgi:hypothetical protein
MLGHARTLVRYAIAGPVLGRCPICETRTVFIKTGPWLRDQLFWASLANFASSLSAPSPRSLFALITGKRYVLRAEML